MPRNNPLCKPPRAESIVLSMVEEKPKPQTFDMNPEAGEGSS